MNNIYVLSMLNLFVAILLFVRLCLLKEGNAVVSMEAKSAHWLDEIRC